MGVTQHLLEEVNLLYLRSIMPHMKPVFCVRQGCSKCLFCMEPKTKCKCSDDEKKGEPSDVMYGWCHKCREKHKTDYDNLAGKNCTYCVGTIEDNYPPAAIAFGVLLFPIGIIFCCMMKEKQCVKCNRSFS